MKSANRKYLLLAGILIALFSQYPAIALIDPESNINGIPARYIYLLGIWIVLIILMMILTSGPKKQFSDRE